MSWRPDYCTTSELASYLRVGDSDDDVQLALAITAASRAIDRTCKRQFGNTTLQVRAYTPRVAGDGRFVADIDDVQNVAGMEVSVSGSVVTGYTLGPVNAAADGEPFTKLFVVAAPIRADAVSVTAAWGWSAVPDAIKQACLLQASRVHARRDSPFGIAGSPDAGSEMRLLAKVDPDVAVMLRPYTRRWWAV